MKTQLQGLIDLDMKQRAKLLRINLSQVSGNAIRKEVKRLELEKKSEVPRRRIYGNTSAKKQYSEQGS